MRYFLLTMWAMFTMSTANYPVFEGAGQLKEILVPADVHIGSVIYRLRASDSDHDYPLQFDATDYGSYVVRVENLPCTYNSTYCEANVYLERVLMVGQVFKFRFTVRDAKGDTTTASVSIEATDAPVDITSIFPHLPGIIILPENTKSGTELEYVIVRRNADFKKPASLEIRGAEVIDFGRVRSSQETTTGVITLKKQLDFEIQNMYKLQIFALDMYTDKLVDTRNIAGFEIILIVEDVQDTPPAFIGIEPTVKLKSNLTQGEIIMKVTAIDGDKGNPRQIRYGLVSEGNPFTIFFNIDRLTGQVTLAKPLKQLTAIARSHQPIMLTILAEEERLNNKEPPSMSSTATIALLLAEAGNTPPYFDNDRYVCHINENSPQGTALLFSDAYSTQVHDDDMGKHGVFSLTLEKNNGTFEITPNVVERRAYFTIRVRNNVLLDYESRKSVEFVIVARELDPGSLSSSVTVLVYLNDVNDNPPQFQRNVYMSQIPENITANAYVTEVRATDIDTDIAGRVHYTRILGFRNSSLLLNSVTGVITVASDNHGFDREEASEYQMTVEARDMEGVGLLATTLLIIRILDVNDETPTFEDAPFHFTLTSDLRNFSTRAVIKATDKDAEPPNNIVRYEIISGNYNNKFMLNSETGELTVRNSEPLNGLRRRRQILGALPSTSNVNILAVRAYDLGVPHRWSTAQVRIFPPDTGTRLLTFVLPAKGIDYGQMEELLIKITGGQVTILEIKSYHPHRYTRSVTESSRKSSTKEKSTVVARITYGDSTVIDIEHVYYLLQSIFYNGFAEPADQIAYQKAESSTNLFWILLIILLLLIAICIAFLLCYILKCQPCYNFFYRNEKKNQVSGTVQTINLHNKGVQANNRLETRSSTTDSNHRNQWRFYRRREQQRGEPQPMLLIPKNMSPAQYRNAVASLNEDVAAPTFIYRAADLPDALERHGGGGGGGGGGADLYIQDIADSEYHILDPSKLNVHRYNGTMVNVVEKSKKYNGAANNFNERKRREITPINREETFVREGQAEILRLQTNEKPAVEENLLHQPDRTYYRRMHDSSKSSSSHSDNARVGKADSKTCNRGGNSSSSSSSSSASNSSSSSEDENRRPDTVDQTRLETVPSKEESAGAAPSTTKAPPSDEEKPPLITEANNVATTQHAYNNAHLITSAVGLTNGGHVNAFRNLFDASHLEEERQRLTSFQRDLLLTRFLVEEQRRYLSQTVDTQSLPGSFSMATQTDRHQATQTDVLCLMRPEPRKAKSENDDSSDSEVDCLYKKTKTYRRYYGITGKDQNRYKIRTPIIEEAETVDGRQSGGGGLLVNRDTKTSLLRLASTRNQIITREALREANAKLDLKYSKSKCKSYGDLNAAPVRPRMHISLRDSKKSASFVDIRDQRHILTEKEMYTPRSLKSRIIARRLSASEPPKIGAHCMSHLQQDARDRLKAIEKDPYAAEWCKKCEQRSTARAKCQHMSRGRSKTPPASRPPPGRDNSGGSNSSSGNKSENAADEERATQSVTVSSVPGGGITLRLKSKNQPLMEKKSVFTIAYGDTTTKHNAETNGNGSAPESTKDEKI